MLLVFGIALLIVEGYENFCSLPTFLFVLTSCHRALGRGSPTKFEMKMLFSSAAVVQKGLELFFSYEILSCADAEMFDQYVLNVKLLGYLINLLQDAKQGPVINVAASLLNMHKYANMQHTTNFWTDRCEVRLEICIYSTAFFYRTQVRS